MPQNHETAIAPVAPRGEPRARIVEALMQLAAERRFEDISLRDIAARAHVSLGEFRDAYPSKGAVLGGFNRRLDRAVLDQSYEEMASESPRERLFDVLMRRLEAMAPYREALKELYAWARRDPLALGNMNRMIVNSMRFMLEAAGVDNDGPAGAVKLQGLVIAWVRIVGVWLDDNDPGLSHTMAELDRELTRGEQFARGVDQLDAMASPLRRLAEAALEAGVRLGERRSAFAGERAGAQAARED